MILDIKYLIPLLKKIVLKYGNFSCLDKLFLTLVGP